MKPTLPIILVASSAYWFLQCLGGLALQSCESLGIRNICFVARLKNQPSANAYSPMFPKSPQDPASDPATKIIEAKSEAPLTQHRLQVSGDPHAVLELVYMAKYGKVLYKPLLGSILWFDGKWWLHFSACGWIFNILVWHQMYAKHSCPLMFTGVASSWSADLFECKLHEDKSVVCLVRIFATLRGLGCDLSPVR